MELAWKISVSESSVGFLSTSNTTVHALCLFENYIKVLSMAEKTSLSNLLLEFKFDLPGVKSICLTKTTKV